MGAWKNCSRKFSQTFVTNLFTDDPINFYSCPNYKHKWRYYTTLTIINGRLRIFETSDNEFGGYVLLFA